MISLLPYPARVLRSVAESVDTHTLDLRPEPAVPALEAARPGQFVMLSLLGIGEAAFTPSWIPAPGCGTGTLRVTVRRIGRLTAALCAFEAGARIGIRGPFGRGFPSIEGRTPTLYVAGGCGLAPLRPAIEAHLGHAGDVPLGILYGTGTFDGRIFADDLARWGRTPLVRLIECVERPDAGWHGRVGTVGHFLAEAVGQIGARRAVACGPPPMLAHVARRLVTLGLEPADIHVALERYMKCGVGLCGHCYVNHRYVCTDGPVFSFAELAALPDAFRADAAPGAAC